MNKSTRTVGFDFAQPTDGSRVERSRNSSTGVHSFSEITLLLTSYFLLLTPRSPLPAPISNYRSTAVGKMVALNQ
jgi:hypothetical protein